MSSRRARRRASSALLLLIPAVGCSPEHPAALTDLAPIADTDLSHALFARNAGAVPDADSVWLHAWLALTSGTADCADWFARTDAPTDAAAGLAAVDAGVVVAVDAVVDPSESWWVGTYTPSATSGGSRRFSRVETFADGTVYGVAGVALDGEVRIDVADGNVVAGRLDLPFVAGTFEAIDCGAWAGVQ